MAAQICLKTDVGANNSFPFRETLSNKWTPAAFASRMLIGLNLTSCQIEISRSVKWSIASWMSSKLESVIWLRVLVTLAYMKGRTDVRTDGK